MNHETAHKILSVHQAWRRGLVDTMEYTAAEVNEALQLAITALQSDPETPDWSQAPEWANYYAIDDDGQCFWYENEPVRRGNDFYPSSGRDQLHIKKKSTTLFKRPDQ